MNRRVKKMTSRGLAISGSLAAMVKKVFKKHQADHANIMVSSTVFYILLTFIPCKYFFQYFVLYAGRFTAFFGTYGVFIAFLFWVYLSVFVFIACAELLSVSSEPDVNGPRPNYARFRWKR